jgi:predicted porin
MKRPIFAFALALTAGVASAQSSVTLFGIVDATIAYGSASGPGGGHRWQLTNSGYNSSRLGVRGVEDLGSGLSASFWLEMGIANDNGTGVATNTNNQASGTSATALNGGQGLTFNRRSTVSLNGSWGELRVGRDYTPQFWNLVFDPFGVNGVGTTQTWNSIITGVTNTRASNSIGYFLPKNLGGVYGQAMYYLGENASNAANSGDGKGYGVRIGYANGSLDAGLTLSRTQYAAGNVQQNNAGMSYNFGVAKLSGQLSRDKNGLVTGRGWLIGASAPVGVGEFKVAYSRYETDAVGDPRTSKIAAGYVHNLSKRTAIYTTVAFLRNSGGAAQVLNGAVAGGPNQNSTGLDIGLRHSF